MTKLDSLRENNKIFVLISRFQNSFLYPALFAVICAIAGVNGKEIYVPCFIILMVLAILSAIFSDDCKVFLVPIIMYYYMIGMDVPENYFSLYAAPSFDKITLIAIIGCGVVGLSAFAWRMICDGYIKELFTKRGIFFWGLLLMGVSLVLGGLFSREWGLSSLGFAVLMAFFLVFVYMLFLVILAHSKDGIAYLCKTVVCLGFAISAQILTIAYRLHINDNFLRFDEGIMQINRLMFSTSWGVATVVGATLVPPIMAAIYLMRNRRFPLLSLASALLFLGVTVVINTRSAMIMGAMGLLFGIIICVIGGKNKKINRISFGVLAALGVLGAITLVIKFPDTYKALLEKIISLLRFDNSEGISESLGGRPLIWAKGLRDFLSAPLFGTGFKYGYFDPSDASSNLFANMYHNVLVQFLASTGIVGSVLLIVHFKQMFEVFSRRFSLDKLLLLSVSCSILIMSFVDNFFFYPNFIMIYVAFLAAAEIFLEQKRAERRDNVKAIPKDRKPRVVFTYVEAGKGHIVPTNNVYESFKRKYGDQVEVVASNFFTETGDEELEKTEKLFARAVKQQNRSPVLSFLCKLGNLIAGDAFALHALLSMTSSGRSSNPRAVKHVEDLDADLIYTAHWSIPFYVNQLKAPHPYVICFCPDAYSNGAFNVDCNNFLISSDVGYKQIERIRMYAGGNVTLVPFPMRPDADFYRADGKKSECRAKLGIPDDEFVVVLCDGGYGMARLEKTAKALLRSKQKMTVIALCGTNKVLYDRLSDAARVQNDTVRLIPVDFTNKVLEYLVCADVFAGKSGANSIAEPATLGIPIIVTKCITYIERGIKNYYVRKIKGAMYIPNSYLATKKIRKFAADPSLLERYKKNLRENTRQNYDAEASADLIWQRLNEIRN